MKFARRRPTEGSDAADAPPPPPTPPRGAPVAAFAGILDGQRLWLAIDDAPGSLALRDTASGDVIAPENEVPADDQPGYRAARVDLAQLPGDAEATYDVVLVPARNSTPKPVRSEPLTAPRPRPAADGRTQWRLDRTDDGLLQVHRGVVEEAVELRSIEVSDDGLRMTMAGAGGTLALLADDETVLTLPLTPADDLLTVTIDAASLPDPADQPAQVVVGEPGAWLPVRRRANDLAEPGRGAPLPALVDQDDRERLRLRWSPRALLLARVLDPEEPE
ncbi:MAG TPA: hypothetical protein VNQ53_06540 [Nocardioides sp.]|nr:hypothetical protein [Nocardioides sp.]